MYFSYNDKVICSKNDLAWLLWQKNLVALFVSSRILITKQNVRICTALSSSLFQSFVYARIEVILSPTWLKIDKNLYLKWHVLQVVLCQKLTTEYFTNTSILIFDLFLTKFHSFFEFISDLKSDVIDGHVKKVHPSVILLLSDQNWWKLLSEVKLLMMIYLSKANLQYHIFFVLWYLCINSRRTRNMFEYSKFSWFLKNFFSALKRIQGPGIS